MMRRKAQGGMNAAVLIAILSALIIIYIIFLPSDERLDIVGENASEREDRRNEDGKILLEDTSLIMEHFDDDEVERDIPSVNLYTSTDANIITQSNSVYVKNGVFDELIKEIEFSIDDPDNTQNILISFFAKTAKGVLTLTLNNREVFSGEIEKVNVDPIRVSSDIIARNNKLVISVEGVGAAFWKTNEYLLENFQVTGDVTDTSTRKSTVTFVIPSIEAKNIEEVELRFVPECEEGRVGPLDIQVNEHTIFNSIPDCGVARPIEFSPFHIVSGQNTLTFASDRGRYLIDQIRIDTMLTETPSFTFFFDIDSDDFQDIIDGDKKVNLSFSFTDDREDKEAELIINDRKTFMTRHDDFEFSININRFVERGSNSLKVIPEEKLEVRKLQVLLQDDD